MQITPTTMDQIGAQLQQLNREGHVLKRTEIWQCCREKEAATDFGRRSAKIAEYPL